MRPWGMIKACVAFSMICMAVTALITGSWLLWVALICVMTLVMGFCNIDR